MAKKTAAGGKARKPVTKSKRTPETPSNGSWSGGDKYNSNFMDHKNSDGKFKAQRIEKKRG